MGDPLVGHLQIVGIHADDPALDLLIKGAAMFWGNSRRGATPMTVGTVSSPVEILVGQAVPESEPVVSLPSKDSSLGRL